MEENERPVPPTPKNKEPEVAVPAPVGPTVCPTMPEMVKYDPNIMKKLNQLRAKVAVMDWTPDKVMTLQGRSTPYVSIMKIKGNFAPALAEVGLEMDLFFDELTKLPAIGNMTQHWLITLYGRFIDIETGASHMTRVFGEAADTGDKAVKKAQTCALSVWLGNYWLISSDMDVMSSPTDDEAPTGFKKKSPQETEEVRSKILDNAVKPATPATPAKPAKPAKPKTLDDVPEKPAEKPAENDAEITSIQQKAIDKITETWHKAAEEGKLTSEQYNEMSMACASIDGKAAAKDFISKYKDVPE